MRRAGAVALTALLLGGCASDVGSSHQTDDPSASAAPAGRLAAPSFSWTVRPSAPVAPPSKAFGEVHAASLEWLADSEHRPGASDIAVVGVFRSSTEAEAGLGVVRRLLSNGTGRYAAVTEAAVQMGPLLVVRGIRADWQRQSAREVLADLGANVVLIEDRAGSPSFVTDLSCEPTRLPGAAALADDLLAFGLSPTNTLRPPWVAPTLTEAERLGRSTLYRAALREGALEEPYDGSVLAAYQLAAGESDLWNSLARKVLPALGQLEVERAHGKTYPTVDAEFDAADVAGVRLGERLEIAGFRTGAFVPGLARLLMLLDDAGCEDVRIALIRL